MWRNLEFILQEKIRKSLQYNLFYFLMTKILILISKENKNNVGILQQTKDSRMLSAMRKADG